MDTKDSVNLTPETGLWLRRGVKRDSYFSNIMVKGHYVRQFLSTDKKEARVKLAKLRIALENSEFQGQAGDINKDWTLNQLVDKYLESYSKVHCKKSWKKCDGVYGRRIKEDLGKLTLREFTIQDAEEFRIARLKLDINPKTVNAEMRMLKSLFFKAIEWGYLDKHPIKTIKSLKVTKGRIRFLSTEEYKLLISTAEKLEMPKIRDWITWSVFSGVRPDESSKVSKSKDVDFKREQVFLADTKNGDSVHQPLNKTALEVMKRQVEDQPWDIEYYKQFIKVRNKAGLSQDVTPYTCRHTFASWLAASGVPILDIQKLMRHKDIKMTLIYAHLAPCKIKEDLEKLDIITNSSQDNSPV